MNTNSNSVARFSGLGEVTKIFEYLNAKLVKTETRGAGLSGEDGNYPKATAAAMATPRAADFPRPLAAVRTTVLRSVFSVILSMNVIIAFAYVDVSNYLLSSVRAFFEYLINSFGNTNQLINLRDVFDRSFQLAQLSLCHCFFSHQLSFDWPDVPEDAYEYSLYS